MRIKVPATVKSILDILHAHGYEAYAVGGCVRDSILGREPNDWDITTSARPDQVKDLFRRTVDTGIQHGTITVLEGNAAHEVTTYRIDGEYLDGRHPENVAFTSKLSEDLRRRDFTINAMAYNEEEGLVDLYGGVNDLQKKIIRCVGNPFDRFSEDALRILRAVRFSAQLKCDIDHETKLAIKELAHTLDKISAERICMEIIKLLKSNHPHYLKKAYDLGITKVVLPEFDRMMETEQHNPHHMYSVGEHSLVALTHVRADKDLRLAMLLHDIGKPDAKTTDSEGVDHFKGHADISAQLAKCILRRLRMDNDTIHNVVTLVKYHDWRIEPTEKAVRRAMNKIGVDLFPALLDVQYADTMAQSDFQRKEKLSRIRQVSELYKKILEEKQCVTLADLAINGRDLVERGIPKGPQIGEKLHKALDMVLEHPEWNTKEILLSKIMV